MHTLGLVLPALLIAVAAAGQVLPNHAAINERRKHIDVDTPWLDKTQRQVQHVGLDASDKEKVLVDLVNERKQLR